MEIHVEATPLDSGSSGSEPALQSPGQAILQCRGLKKSFRRNRGSVQVLDGIDLEVGRGEFLVVTGRSGAGKSTLLGLLAGLELPSSGSVVFEGRRLEDLSGRERAALRRDRIGIIFQSFNLLPSWTALENVEAALLHDGGPRAERREKAMDMLARLGLGERADHLPSELSVGEEHRVAVARTLVNRPALVLADEPTGDVDPQTASEILALLKGLVTGCGATLILATHGAPIVEGASRVLVLEGGKLRPGALPSG